MAYVNLDWTEFDDDQTMLVASVQADHARATPQLWRTWTKSECKGQCNAYEDELLGWLRRCVPKAVCIVIVADRGFADQKLFRLLLDDLGFDLIIRFKQDTLVTDAEGERKLARDWMEGRGRLRRFDRARITADETPIPLVVLMQDLGKEPWCIASSLLDLAGKEIEKGYGERFSDEEMFRDFKDIRYG